MADYVKVLKYESGITVCFYIEDDEIFAIGEKMNELCDEAYMNGYNWEAFLSHYLKKNAPDLLEGMEPDPEATSLIENEEELYRIVQEESEEIEWD